MRWVLAASCLAILLVGIHWFGGPRTTPAPHSDTRIAEAQATKSKPGDVPADGPDNLLSPAPQSVRGSGAAAPAAKESRNVDHSLAAPPLRASLDGTIQARYTAFRRQLPPDRRSERACTTWMERLLAFRSELPERSAQWFKVLDAEMSCLNVLGRPAEAEQTLRELLEAHPDSIELRNVLAGSLLQDGDAEGAWIVLETAMALGGNFETLSLTAVVQESRALDFRIKTTAAESRRRLRASEQALRRLVDESPPFPALVNRTRLSRILSIQGRHESAQAQAQQAYQDFLEMTARGDRFMPGMEASIVVTIAQAHFLAGQTETAQAYVDQALSVAPNDHRRSQLRRQSANWPHLQQAINEALQP